MADQDFININWDDHSKSTISQISKNMDQDILKDVTLACAGGHCIRAHRLILSIYSDYFRQLLTKCTNPEPTILLPDVELHDLEILLTFMYTGKAHVKEENLVNILESAKRFQIKGLLDDVPSVQEGPPAKRRRMDDDSDAQVESENTLSTKQDDEMNYSLETNPVLPNLQWLMMNSLHQLQGPQPTLSQLPDVFPHFKTPSETFEMEDRDNMIGHNKCNICHRFFKNRSSLSSHRNYNHMPMKQPKFCCDQLYITRWDLKLHKSSHGVVNSSISQLQPLLDMSDSILEKSSDSEDELVIDLK